MPIFCSLIPLSIDVLLMLTTPVSFRHFPRYVQDRAPRFEYACHVVVKLSHSLFCGALSSFPESDILDLWNAILEEFTLIRSRVSIPKIGPDQGVIELLSFSVL